MHFGYFKFKVGHKNIIVQNFLNQIHSFNLNNFCTCHRYMYLVTICFIMFIAIDGALNEMHVAWKS